MENRTSKKFIIGIVGLALALFAICCMFIPYFGLILAIVALVLSIIGATSSRLKGFGIGGIIASIIALLFSLLFTFVFTSIFGKAMKAVDAEKKASNIYNSAKTILLEASAMGENTYEGIKVSDDGVTYYITVKNLVSLGEIEKNPFTSNSTDGGMTITYDTTDHSYDCTVTGKIGDFRIVFKSSTETFDALLD